MFNLIDVLTYKPYGRSNTLNSTNVISPIINIAHYSKCGLSSLKKKKNYSMYLQIGNSKVYSSVHKLKNWCVQYTLSQFQEQLQQRG